MKPVLFPDLPEWTYTMDEVSANVFKIMAESSSGLTIELTGTDPDLLIQECYQEAKKKDFSLKQAKEKYGDFALPTQTKGK